MIASKVSVRHQDGMILLSNLFLMIVFLIGASIAAAKLAYAIQLRAKDQAVVSIVEHGILPALDSYFFVECYANNGIVATPTLSDLVDEGYLTDTPINPLGEEFELTIDRSSGITLLGVSAEFPNESIAKRLAKRASETSVENISEVVTWSRTSSQLAQYEQRIEHGLYVSDPCI